LLPVQIVNEDYEDHIFIPKCFSSKSTAS